MDTHVALGEFLRSRRAGLTPERAGLPTYGEQRRVPGLRRTELAALAGLSPSYYTHLEQGHSTNASAQVLDALARVLRLDPQEHEHLYLLAQPRSTPAPGERVRPEARQLMRAITAPAVLGGRFGDVLAWNRPGHALFAGHLDHAAPDAPATRPNLARLVVLDPHSRDLYADWPGKVAGVAAHLRFSIGRYPRDRAGAGLVEELCGLSPDFARAWAEHGVRTCGDDPIPLRHPAIGELTVFQHTSTPPRSPGQSLMIFLAEEDSPSEAVLSRLAV